MCSDVVAALTGVAATLAGTILGWMLNHFSNRGKLNIFVASWKDEFSYNRMGEMVDCVKREEVQCYTFYLSLDLYNSSGNTKIMRNIKIIFSDGKNNLKTKTPMDDATKRYSGTITFYDEITPINIPPKTIVKINLHEGDWEGDGLEYLWKTRKVYLIYLDEKNKLRRKLVHMEDYENYFDNLKPEEKNNE